MVEPDDLAAVGKHGYTPGRLNGYIYDIQLAPGKLSQPFEGSTVNKAESVQPGFCQILSTGLLMKAQGKLAASYEGDLPVPFVTFADDQAATAAEDVLGFMCPRTYDSTATGLDGSAGSTVTNSKQVCKPPDHKTLEDCQTAWKQLAKAPPAQPPANPGGQAQLGWAPSYAAKVNEFEQQRQQAAAAQAAVTAKAETFKVGAKVKHIPTETEAEITGKFMGKFMLNPVPAGVTGPPGRKFVPAKDLELA